MSTEKEEKISNEDNNQELKKTENTEVKETKEETNSELKETPKQEEKKSEVEKEEETKAEQVVFKSSEKKEDVAKTPRIEKESSKAEAAKQEILKSNENSKRKAGAIAIILIIILATITIFSTAFALIHSTKNTIAKGVKINNIDLSCLTYDEAKDKLKEAFRTTLDVDIDLSYEDYNYKITPEDVQFDYDFQNELDEAYKIGRNGNILECNYDLILTAFIGKEFKVDYKYEENDVDTIVEEISTSVPGLVTQYSHYIDGDNLIINPGTDGIKVEKEKLKEIIINDLKNRNPVEIIKDFKNYKETIPCQYVKADEIDMDKVYSEVHTEPENAYFIAATDTEKAKIFADVDGIDFAISIDEAKEKLKEEATEYVIPISRQKAEVTINDIGLEAFPNLLEEFSTRYDASNWGRSENLKIATGKIDGTVLMPGQQFSFNGVVGERTVQEGYKNAAIFSNGKVEDGLAGGICQISSTLYNAALLANLQIDERFNHSFKTSYLPYGRDATVVYGIKDLKFTNNRSYPIKIDGSAENGVVTFAIYGIEEDTEYEINIIPIVTSTIPYTTQTTVDYSLDPGETYLVQGGQSGARVVTYKETILNGEIISKEEITNDTYQAMSRIVKTGPDGAPVNSAPETPSPEPEPEAIPEPEAPAEASVPETPEE